MAEKRKSSRGTPNKGGKKPRSSGGTVMDPIPASDTYRKPWEALAGWFLGPRAENRESFSGFALQAINTYADCRERYYPADPCYMTEKVLNSRACQSELKDLDEQLAIMGKELEDSIPFYSTRYQGHMTWECVMPAMLGYLAGMLWNQNNVDSTASPVTTQYEIKVGEHLCQLMNFDNNDIVSPWAHLTGCGSVANLESMWAARNMKFHPLALQAACNDRFAGDLAAGATTPVYVPELGTTKPLNECTQWQLLNLDVDTICKLTEDVRVHAGLPDNTLIDEKLKKHSVVNIGMGEFMMQHKMKTTPCILSPGTNHYSWPKSATVLGIGDHNVIPVNVDGNARQDLEELRKKLAVCLKTKRAVIMVVAVIGSTEESAVDPLEDILAIRDEFRADGLNFAVHADAAWGGYLLTMIRPPSAEMLNKFKARGEDFVPALALSDYAIKQYHAIRHADTVTIDPHKAGLCQYPAGALAYRNGTMKGFITLMAPEVFHGEDDVSVGVYGLEGSKPGAAACGVLLAHRVIGLDQMGYGRILGQCQLGSKLMYCMWMVTAEDYDDFEVVNFIALPDEITSKFTPEQIKVYIKERILGRLNEDLFKDKEAMDILRAIGPDALINSFTVNVKGNQTIAIVNNLQNLLFGEMTTKVGQSSKRVPLFLTTSLLARVNYGAALDQLKERLGLPVDDEPLGFLRNTAMNPFQASGDYLVYMQKIFRTNILNCIGGLSGNDGESEYGDQPMQHTFVVSGRMDKTGKVFLDYMPSFRKQETQYHVVLTMKASTASEKDRFRTNQKGSQVTFFARTKVPITMYNLVHSEAEKIQMEFFRGKVGGAKVEISMQLDEVFRHHHLETIKASEFIEYPEHQQYFLYGDKKRAYISHIITKHEDFHQVVQLDELPHSVPVELLDLGVVISLPDIPGSPLYLNDQIADPLQADKYVADFKGKQFVDSQTTIKFGKRNAKRWFDSKLLNESS